ncbi:MAG: hypothetical protein IPM36_18160 [Lewinellaceae bacterium]|nr:hypothetical protein [Lewinellaceae bacterium]
MNKLALLLLICIGLGVPAGAQRLSGISSRWSDSFVEWELFAFAPDSVQASEDDAPEEIAVGALQLRWLNVRDDWTEWEYSIGEEQGTIRMKWKDDPSQWELRTYSGDVISMRTAWRGDFSEWRVTDNTISLTLRSRWTSQLDEWLVQENTSGSFYMYTLVEGDPRDWAIEDGLDETVSQPMKMALIFLTVFHASPRI